MSLGLAGSVFKIKNVVIRTKTTCVTTGSHFNEISLKFRGIDATSGIVTSSYLTTQFLTTGSLTTATVIESDSHSSPQEKKSNTATIVGLTFGVLLVLFIGIAIVAVVVVKFLRKEQGGNRTTEYVDGLDLTEEKFKQTTSQSSLLSSIMLTKSASMGKKSRDSFVNVLEQVRVTKEKQLLMSDIITGKLLGEGHFSFVYEYVPRMSC